MDYQRQFFKIIQVAKINYINKYVHVCGYPRLFYTRQFVDFKIIYFHDNTHV